MKTILILILILVTAAHGQVDKNSELFIALKQRDSIFFERGFNLCDIEFLKENIVEDLIFYHDQSGIQNKAQFLENSKKYICS
ncbi:MAG: nuclear transport factor 2 family protein, partial [Flavobacteriaceae bacterium]|nr:nuclear transport factor 2 family protein [Flavobacteriaceae bacterium]